MASSLMKTRCFSGIQASCCVQPLRARSVLAGSSRHQQRAGQKHQLLPIPPQPIGHGWTAAAAPTVGTRQSTIMHSFLGVGAPEAILVAVVALVVFGPKGLADAAKSLGQTLRAFQPTIKEVVEVSQEIKGTLEQELGLDELRTAATMRPTPRPMQQNTASSSSSTAEPEASSSGGNSSSSGSSTPPLQAISEDMARQLDPEIELKRAMSEQAAWGGQPPAAGSAAAAAAVAAPAAAAAADKPTAPAAAPAQKDLSALSLEELEAELARRRNKEA